jgi:hypothetical protein
MIALIAVIDAQKMNGTVIRNSYNLAGRDEVSRKSHSLPIAQCSALSLPFITPIRNRFTGRDFPSRFLPLFEGAAETTVDFSWLVQLGGLEPPTSCSTDRPPSPRPSRTLFVLRELYNPLA